jgi:hypothetical protein
MEHDETRVHHLDGTTPWPGGADEDTADEIETPPVSSRTRRIAGGAGLVVGGLLAGTLGITAVQAATGATRTQQPTAAQQGLPQQGLPQQGVPQGAGPGSTQGGPPAGRFGGRPGGAVAGEQRVFGTVATVFTNAVAVTTSSGKVTYVVNGTTDVRRNGQPITLSALHVGENVFLHVYPVGTAYVAERIYAGTTSFGPGGGRAPNGSTTSSSPSPGTTRNT